MRRPFRFPAATAHEWGGKAGRPSEPAGSTRRRSGRDGSRSSCEEVGYIQFEPEAAALLFAFVSSRYERTSLIVNSNKTFSAWAEMFSDPIVVAAMVDHSCTTPR
jgi:IstB-like ATP binding protein